MAKDDIHKTFQRIMDDPEAEEMPDGEPVFVTESTAGLFADPEEIKGLSQTQLDWLTCDKIGYYETDEE